MSFEDLLRDRCTIQRATESRGSSGEVIQTWADHLNMEPCRLSVMSERVASPNGFLMASAYMLALRSGLDVTTGDRVSFVAVDGSGSIGPFWITEVLPRRGGVGVHHTTLRLEKIA